MACGGEGAMLPELKIHTWRKEGAPKIDECRLEYNLTKGLYLWVSHMQGEKEPDFYLVQDAKKWELPVPTWIDMVKNLKNGKDLFKDTTPIFKSFHMIGCFLCKISNELVSFISKETSDRFHLNQKQFDFLVISVRDGERYREVDEEFEGYLDSVD